MGTPFTSATTPPRVMYSPEEAPIFGGVFVEEVGDMPTEVGTPVASLRGPVGVEGVVVGTGFLPRGMVMAGRAASPAPTSPPLPVAVPPSLTELPARGWMKASGVRGWGAVALWLALFE